MTMDIAHDLAPAPIRPCRIRKLAERANARKKKGQTSSFSWIFNREVELH